MLCLGCRFRERQCRNKREKKEEKKEDEDEEDMLYKAEEKER